MPQEAISQRIKRTCDGCGTSKEWELIGITEPTVLEMTEWYQVNREVLTPNGLTKLTGWSCSLSCLPAAGVKLALPPMAEETPLDLASLRVGDLNAN